MVEDAEEVAMAEIVTEATEAAVAVEVMAAAAEVAMAEIVKEAIVAAVVAEAMVAAEEVVMAEIATEDKEVIKIRDPIRMIPCEL